MCVCCILIDYLLTYLLATTNVPKLSFTDWNQWMRFLPQTNGVNALTALINNDHKMKKKLEGHSVEHISLPRPNSPLQLLLYNWQVRDTECCWYDSALT